MPTLDDLKNTLCLGIAGNFAGHLEQAGETPDFVNVKTKEAKAPKGIFPYFVPGSEKQVGEFPLSDNTIRYPQDLAENAHLQAEPEVCVLFQSKYEYGKIVALQPVAFAAFNDCSIRKPGAKKISEKKNWGPETKGISADFLPVSTLQEGGELESFRIASFLIRDGEIHTYGNDSAVNSYSYFYGKLQEWMIETLNHQADFGPLENLNQIVHQAGFPKQLMISLGATTYSEFGENVFLQPGDKIKIYVYDGKQNSPEEIAAHASGQTVEIRKASVLQQQIR
ncbi:DUF5718 family protein [Thiomicrorhabdus sp. 6S3-12]|uniref:DUF5718 family protein n=1 Tax=Thiomicrorhabdus sp. 6S3-12 TaxID=2819681 RepID=UPI001AAD79AF|nr:DUF5718 family protein [Thiomicrorhabdus sp. 6S3-12]MBO1924447.1 hypothetical protein [Thiomicrorhabdus sp. 6S3-12]